MTRTFRKRPVEIQAMQWTGENTSDVIDWVLATGQRSARWHEAVPGIERDAEGPGRDPEPEHIAIDTLEGTMHASIGDWVIRGVQGEHYPCKPEIFEATYEAAPTAPIAAIRALIDELADEVDPEDQSQADLMTMLRIAADAYPLAILDTADPRDRLALAVGAWAQSGLAVIRANNAA